MKALISSSSRSRKIRIHLPLFFAKTRLFASLFTKDKDYDLDPKVLHLTMKRAYAEIKSYVRRNGHFNLVDIHSHEGDRILIEL